jgi:hypothetical protein
MITSIKEANDLTTHDLTTLFGKIEEHQSELMSVGEHEKRIKKNKAREWIRKSQYLYRLVPKIQWYKAM